jgi:predicted TIM-barrel fold metal-dependent hydrolase
MSIVDFHAHFFSRPYFEALAAQSPLPGTIDQKLEAVAKKAKIELPSRDLAAHLARWIGELDRNSVDQMACFASAPEETAAVAEACALSDGRLVPFALVDPRTEGAAQRVAGLLDGKGFRGVLLFPALHHYSIAGAECEPLLRVLDERRAIAYVHCGVLIVKLRDLFGLPRAIDVNFANPLSIVPAANKFPRAHFVIPHFGAGLFRETLIAGAQCSNVYVDTSSSNAWVALQEVPLSLRQVFERAIAAFGHERILFGTDSNVFPAGWRADRWEAQRTALADLGADAAQQAMIFADNARRLLSR